MLDCHKGWPDCHKGWPREERLQPKSRGHWFSLMGTVLPFEIITYAI